MAYTVLLSSHDMRNLRDIVNEGFRTTTFLTRVAKAATFTVWAGDASGIPEDYYACTGTYAVTMPAANSTDAAAGRVVRIKNVGAGTITVTAAGADTIEDGVATTLALAADQAATLISDGTSNWEII